MALSKIFKKNDAPDELPDLAIDELRKELKKDYSEKEEVAPKVEIKKEEKEEVQPPEEKEIKEQPPEETSAPENKEEEEKIEELPLETIVKEIEKPQVKVNEEKINPEKSFFNPLLAELRKENFDPSKINEWYQKKFSEKGAIEEMKEFWEKKKDNFITETIEKEFKERISEKMNNLQILEAEWQEIYINLIKKEEEMKKEEKNVKKIIKDFSQLFVKKGNLKKEHKSK